MTLRIFIISFLIIQGLIGYDIVYSADYWIKQSSPTTRNFKNCFFINNNTGWISGDSGTIIKTTNAGLNWSFQPTGIFNDIQSVYFINERLGWATTYEIFPDTNSFLGTRILKTTDGGNSWINYMYPDSNIFMRSIYFLDSLTGFMVGAPITIARTGNAGNTWENMDTDTTLQLGLPLENIKFINNQVGYACGGFRDIAGAMWTTTNGGFNWKGTIIAPEPFMDLYIFNPSKVISVGGDFEFGASYVNTTNQGLVWNYDTLGSFGVATGIDFRTEYEGWIALGISLKFTYTLDTGKTWTSIYTPDSLPINDVQFTDSLHGWAVGHYGTILKYNSVISSLENEYENINPDSYTLFQNYPNPFNPVTNLEFGISNWGFVSIKIYDVLGVEIATLVNDNLSPGTRIVKFDGSNLSSGVYYYSMHVNGEIVDTRKMVLLK
jgi:photosystem II stability/assembly factor-like uncharacterized protein